MLNCFFKQSFKNQAIFLLVTILLSAGIDYLFDYQPRLQMNGYTLWQGAIAGTIIAVFILMLHILASAIPWISHADTLESITERRPNESALLFLGAIVVTIGGEELFFRAYLFGSLYQINSLLAYSINFVVSLSFYFCGRQSLSWSLIKAIECSLYAALFAFYGSLFIVGIAHAMSEIVFFAFERKIGLAPFVNLINLKRRFNGTRKFYSQSSS